MLVLPRPSSTRAQVSVYNRACGASVNGYQGFYIWPKPKNCSMVYIFCVSGGGGGGGGFSGGGVDGGGGGGGGSGGQSVGIFPAALLPDRLYVSPGFGGTGAAAGATGNAGGVSYVGTYMDNSGLSSTDALMTAGLGGGGGGGTSGAGGAAGTGGSAASFLGTAGLGFAAFYAGQNGTTGGDDLGAVGTAISFPTTGLLVMGGTGGGGSAAADFAGGQITAIADSLLSQSRSDPAAAGGVTGGAGSLNFWKPFFSHSGMGGSSSGTGSAVAGGVGGNGRNGGGGGGGGGSASSTGGRGGDGGPGLVVIVAW